MLDFDHLEVFFEENQRVYFSKKENFFKKY